MSSTTTDRAPTVAQPTDRARVERVELAHGLVGWLRVDPAEVARRREVEREFWRGMGSPSGSKQQGRRPAPQRRGGGRR